MSSRSDWIPIAAGVIVGAGLLALLYRYFSGTPVTYAKFTNQNIGAAKYCCTCTRDGIDLVITRQ